MKAEGWQVLLQVNNSNFRDFTAIKPKQKLDVINYFKKTRANKNIG